MLEDIKIHSIAFSRTAGLMDNGSWKEAAEILESIPVLAKHRDSHNDNLLNLASSYPGGLDMLSKLIEFGSDQDVVSESGNTALANAVLGGKSYGPTTLPELTFLLKQGSDPNLIGPSGYPPLHWAIYHNRLDHAKTLLEFDADPFKKTSDLYPEDAFDVARSEKNQEALHLLDKWK